MKKSLIFLFVFICADLSFASDENHNSSARSTALGDASVTLSDVWAVNNNQAGLAYIKNASGAISYQNRFLLQQLSLKSLAVVLPSNQGAFGISMNSFGYKLYSENRYGISYAKKLAEGFSVGMQLNYFNTRIAEGYGNKGVAVAELGMLVKLSGKLTMGTHIFNPTRAKLSRNNSEYLPTTMRLGFNYTFSEKVFLVTEAQKDLSNKPNLKFGLEYHPVREIYIRTGLSTSLPSYAFGFGLQLKKLKVDFASSFSFPLGIISSAGLIYEVN
jgi:hypothetical protein